MQDANIVPVKLFIIQPTPFCNLDCDYCYLPNRQSKAQMSLDLLEPIFKNLFHSQLIDHEFTVIWHAGEPLSMPVAFYHAAFQIINNLNQDFNQNRCTIYQSIQTNGTLINQDWCDLIKSYQVQMGISLDGLDFIHDAHRKTRKGLGTHASTMRGISLLKANNIDFRVIAVLTKDSLDYPEEMFNFFMENGIKKVGFNIDEKIGAHESSSFETLGIEERYRNFMVRFYELVKSTNWDLKVREFEKLKSKICYGISKEIKEQFTPFIIISIDYQGNFSTFSPELLSMKSSTYGDFILGNVKHDTFESACETDRFQRINQDIQAGVDLCQHTCPYFSVCGGGSPANKYFENGFFDSSETMYCRYSTKILTDIILEDIENSLELQEIH
ncbi:MAG: cyclophane-forming radical SAM/SPASM peptide maturase GrrM/OscB [Nostoc sp. ChiQUE02]|uniref:cyclophane-forming radical SAM/SPASM peptide maturase GrrM/OscB n=1 Tax=Nostoc sp. ChiQUE02 TaxID=3075377 RepID=UPI002AD33D82|nr:cyclophane-forming radical SAM/SPASM peptide maturase GrrM/OscB [Nostoc sp. ChiQUE02]MDZ8229266.1 cyclophane-forming radical SAM/SPASM peptide maturase GrrM/OscB [Nostoc sp. ChiQUE02]